MLTRSSISLNKAHTPFSSNKLRTHNFTRVVWAFLFCFFYKKFKKSWCSTARQVISLPSTIKSLCSLVIKAASCHKHQFAGFGYLPQLMLQAASFISSNKCLPVMYMCPFACVTPLLCSFWCKCLLHLLSACCYILYFILKDIQQHIPHCSRP